MARISQRSSEKHTLMERNDAIKELNDLHELLADGRKGYHETARKVDHPQLAELLERLSRQRDSMQAEMARVIRRLRPDDRLQDGTVKGDLHRAWIDIRETLGTADNTNMLNECERGENYILQRYDEVIADHDVDASTRQLLNIHREQIRENLAMVKTLRKSMEAVEK